MVAEPISVADQDKLAVAVVIVAAGRGARAATDGAPAKQYLEVAGRSVLARAVAAFAAQPQIGPIQIVIGPDDDAHYTRAIGEYAQRVLPAVHGGATRQDSVRKGLEALVALAPDRVLIHDAARPFVSPAVISRVIAALDQQPGAIAAVPVSDTLKRGDQRRLICGSVDRRALWRAQTPQGFAFQAVHRAHAAAHAQGLDDFTDDAAVAHWAGHQVALVMGSEDNVKLTTAEDLAMAERRLAERASVGQRETRSGQGFDVHRLAAGEGLWLCGVWVPHVARLEGHSDADVALHALTDALLGAIGAGDIGAHFPPSQARWKGASSDIFVHHARELIGQRDGRIVNVDITILAEAPKVGPHRAAMCARVAEILDIDPARVSVKATTTEQLGFVGRSEGIAALASASVELPVAAHT